MKATPKKVEKAIHRKMLKKSPSAHKHDDTQPADMSVELRHAHRALTTISRCNKVLVHATSEPELLRDICRVIVKEGGYRLAWVGFAEHDDQKSVRPVAYAGFESGYLEQLRITWADTERGRGPTGTAIRTGRLAMCMNALTDPAFEPWRADAIERGYASSLVLPLRAHGTVFGGLSIYATEPDAFHREELQLLTELADDLSFGISALRDRAERRNAEEALRIAGAYNRSLIEASPDPLVTIGPEGTITDVNSATEIATGFSRDELIGTDFCGYFTDPQKARKGYERVFRDGNVKDYELELLHKDGHITFVLYNASVYRDTSGKVIGVFAAARDMTERKRAQQALEAERQRFNRVLDMIPAYVILLTKDYRVPFANHYFQDRFGKSKGHRCHEYLFGRNEPCENCETYKAMSTGKLHRWQWLGPDKRNYDVYDFPFADSDGSSLILEMGLDITEQLRGEKALAESESKFHGLAEQSLVGIAVNTAEGYVYVNKRLAEMFGYTVDEVMNMSPVDLVQERDRAVVSERIRKRLTGEIANARYGFRGKQKDGSPIEVEIHGSRMEIGGKPASIAVMLDITERKKAEEALRKSEERLRYTMDSMMEGCMIIGHDWTYLYVNESVAHQGHQQRKNLLGKTMLEVYPGVEQSDVFATYRRCMENRVPVRFESEYTFPDKASNWFEFSAVPVPEGIFVLTLDITERKHAEKEIRRLNVELEQRVIDRTRALAESEQRFRTIYDTAPVSIWQEDWRDIIRAIEDLRSEGVEDFDAYIQQHPEFVSKMLAAVKVLDVNEWTLGMFDARNKAEMLASLGTVFATPDTIPSFEGELKALARGKTIYRTEIIVNTLGGKLIHGLLAMSFPPRGSNSGSVLVSVIDITELKRAEESNLKLTGTLEVRASELEAANKELEAFSYSVSHDLRAPLRGIDGFSAALLEDYSDKLDDQGKDYLRRVRSATQRMAELIDDMLELARVTRSEMQIQSVDLTRIADEIAAELQQSDPGRHVSFLVAGNIHAMGDPNLLHIVIENLFGNAWKFTSKNPRSKIEFGNTTLDGKPVLFVRDNGVGFDMQYADRLFGVFQRLHSPAEFPGTGIGLATVQRIVHRHGGRVWAEAAVNQGATFFFTLA